MLDVMQHEGNLGGSLLHRVHCDGGGSNRSVGGPQECGRTTGAGAVALSTWMTLTWPADNADNA